MQTHGFERSRFFAEGASTTAFPGRAALSRGFAVLVVEESVRALFDDRALEARNALAGYRAAIRAVETEVPIDNERIAVIGWSRTSYHVKYALTHAPELFAAAVCADGVDYGYFQYLSYVDMQDFDMGEEFRDAYGGPRWTHWKTWLAEAPGFNLEELRAPLLIQANSMPNVIGEWEFYAGLKRLIFPSGAHSLVRPSERKESGEATLDWLDFWLNGRELPGQEHAERYRRWSKLRLRPTAALLAVPRQIR